MKKNFKLFIKILSVKLPVTNEFPGSTDNECNVDGFIDG